MAIHWVHYMAVGSPMTDSIAKVHAWEYTLQVHVQKSMMDTHVHVHVYTYMYIQTQTDNAAQLDALC